MGMLFESDLSAFEVAVSGRRIIQDYMGYFLLRLFVKGDRQDHGLIQCHVWSVTQRRRFSYRFFLVWVRQQVADNHLPQQKTPLQCLHPSNRQLNRATMIVVGQVRIRFS